MNSKTLLLAELTKATKDNPRFVMIRERNMPSKIKICVIRAYCIMLVTRNYPWRTTYYKEIKMVSKR